MSKLTAERKEKPASIEFGHNRQFGLIIIDQFSPVLYLTKHSWKAESNQSNVIEVKGQAGEMEHKITDLEMTNKLIFHIYISRSY